MSTIYPKSKLKRLLGKVSKHQEAVQAIAEPLMDTYGLNYFSYIRITKDNQYSLLSTEPEFEDFCLSEDNIQSCPELMTFSRHRTVNYLGSFSLLRQNSKTELENNVGVLESIAQKNLEFDHHLVIVTKHIHYVEVCSFFAPPENIRASQNFLGDITVFKSFCKYFTKQAQAMLEDVATAAIPVRELNPHPSADQKRFYHSTIDDRTRRNLLHLFSGSPQTLKKRPLTGRQLECLKYSIEGKTSKQIAEITGLSSRTIEHYLDTVRQKLQCRSKKELVQKVIEGKLLDHL